MTNIDRVLDNLIEREGGYVNHPNDPGGETKYGISKRSFPDEDIKNLTPQRAKELYLQHYVKPHRINDINDEGVAELLLDWVVNGGPAVRSLQRLLDVTIDGIIGDETLSALNTTPSHTIYRQFLYDRLFYLVSLTKHPFIKGWMRRLINLGL